MRSSEVAGVFVLSGRDVTRFRPGAQRRGHLRSAQGLIFLLPAPESTPSPRGVDDMGIAVVWVVVGDHIQGRRSVDSRNFPHPITSDIYLRHRIGDLQWRKAIGGKRCPVDEVRGMFDHVRGALGRSRAEFEGIAR